MRNSYLLIFITHKGMFQINLLLQETKNALQVKVRLYKQLLVN